MAENSKIEWSDHTFMDKVSTIESFAPFEFPLVANAIRFEVLKFMAWMTKGYSIAYIVSKVWILSKRFYVVRSKVPAFPIVALLTGVIISKKDSVSPSEIFNSSSIVEIALSLSMFIGVVIFSASSSFPSFLTDLLSSFSGVMFSRTVTRSFLSRLTHLIPRLFAHLFTFHRWNKVRVMNVPQFFHLAFGFFCVCHVANYIFKPCKVELSNG